MGRIAQAVESSREEVQALLQREGVVLAYLFGSAEQGRERPDSDLDLAILFGRQVPPSIRGEIRLELLTRLVGLTHINDIDLVVLNDAPPLLAYQIATTGRPILGDRREQTQFHVRAIQRFIDTQPIRDLLAAGLERRIREAAPPSRGAPW